MGCWQRNPWWLRLTCFFFFGGLACYVPFLTAHLKWLGLELSEIAAINLISSVFSAAGLLLAASWTPRCGHRSNLAVSILMAAFCGAGLLLVPRIQGRGDVAQDHDRAVAEILCRPEGSVLFFSQCGNSCELDTTVRTELVVSDCRFEAVSKLPTRKWLNWVNHVPLPDPSLEDDDSEPERGDLPQKVAPDNPEVGPGPQPQPLDPSDMEGNNEEIQEIKQRDQWTQETPDLDPLGLGDHNHSSNTGLHPIDPYDPGEEDYADRNGSTPNARVRRQDQTGLAAEDYDGEQEEADEPLTYKSSPHICFSSHSAATTCHVFIGTSHAFRFNTSFYSGEKQDGLCFYALRYDDVDQQILSELSCRSNKPDNQVRCRADGVDLRLNVGQNGTDDEACPPPSNYFHLTFWLYLILRTLGEIAVVAAIILLPIVALNDREEKEFFRRMGQVSFEQIAGDDHLRQQQMNQVALQEETDSSRQDSDDSKSTPNLFWIWSLAGCILFGPVAGLVSDLIGFGVGFLMGCALFGIASFMIALSPPRSMSRDDHLMMPPYRITAKDLCEILSNRAAVSILMLALLFGMATAVVHTPFYWYLVELNASRLLLGVAIAVSVVLVPFIFPFKSWLWRKCGHNYIFIIGLLLYTIRFLGYSLLSNPMFLVALETLDPLCSSWMLLTSAIRIGQLEPRKQLVRKVNIWALIILFHYSFGRGLGGLFSSMGAHHFGATSVFVGSAMISLFAASLWIMLLHVVFKPQRKFRLFNRPPSQHETPSNNFRRGQ